MAWPSETPRENRVEAAELEAFRPALRRYFARRLSDPSEIEDMVQEALARLIACGQGADAPRNPQAWLFRVARNLIADHYRAASGRTLEPLETATALALDGERPRQEERRCLADLQFLLEEALSELSETCRSVFILRRFEECSTAEIAARLGISRRMVQKHLVQAVTHLYVRLRPVLEQLP